MPNPLSELNDLKSDIYGEPGGHLEHLNWLLDGARRSGRTYLLAIAFIEHAMRSNGMWIVPFDHNAENIQFGNGRMLEVIRSIEASRFSPKLFEYRWDARGGGSFRYAGSLISFPDEESREFQTNAVEKPPVKDQPTGRHRTMDIDDVKED